jgi:hypothetical protein
VTTPATFKLKCVGCGAIDRRDAEECREQPFCTKCYCPMILESATVNLKPKRKGTRR